MRNLKLKSLGKKGSAYFGLETFKAPSHASIITCESDEVTALCPVTNQPDWYKVVIDYSPDRLCVESKSLKLYLHTFRNKGHFCEAFADIIAKDLFAAMKPVSIDVSVTQKSRGGISIIGRASLSKAVDGGFRSTFRK